MSDTVIINIRDDEDEKFPSEISKTIYALVLMLFSLFLTTFMLAFVHDYIPNRSYEPLPDVILSNLPIYEWALDISEIIIMVSNLLLILIIVLQKHRFIIFRRLFLIMAVIYFLRSICFSITLLPVPNTVYYCAPKEPSSSIGTVFLRAFNVLTGFGLSINGKHVYCGDYIFSGHTAILVMGYLFVAEYTPNYSYIFHHIFKLFPISGVIFLFLAHGHYTIDVVVAYYITTRIFWIYHTHVNTSIIEDPNNSFRSAWWYCILKFFEGRVYGRKIPLEFNGLELVYKFLKECRCKRKKRLDTQT